jgi:hypothetical protein
MRESIDTSLNAQLSIDDSQKVRQITQLQEMHRSSQDSPLLAALEYLRRTAGILQLADEMLQTAQEKVSFSEPREQGSELRLGQQKQMMDSATIIFNQTYLNVPVWRAAITVTLKLNPTRVISVTDTTEQGVNAPLPSNNKIEQHRTLFALTEAERRVRTVGLAEKLEAAGMTNEANEPKTASFVRRILGRTAADSESDADDARAIRGRFFVYQYREESRLPAKHPHPVQDPQLETEVPLESIETHEDAPTLKLPAVKSKIKDGDWRLVSEVTFALRTAEHGSLNWRALVDVETESVLLLEPLVAGLNGMVFHRDPISSSGNAANSPNQGNAILNPLRNSIVLPNLDAAVGGVQSLRGRFAVVTNVEPPNIAPPTQSVGVDFNFDARTNDFAAVNAYYHTDRFFALVEDLGFPIASYFDNTAFPVRVDHRDNVQGNANAINARCVGNGEGGIGFAGYALNDLSDTANPIGRACDSRVHLHELGGHGILYEHVDHANFGFAHSAGDSLSAILHDPDSQAPDRFQYAPWNPVNTRRFDRAVQQGWAWGGVNDDKQYKSEEILATTLFRVYRSIGGDAADVSRKRFASRTTMYLILRAVSTLTPASNPSNALGFANALMTVDLLNWTSEGVFGGAYNKVIRWSFEKQGLYQASGTPLPITTAGRPPQVDVYIDDGRAGEYQYQPDSSNNPSIWNRRAADGGTAHEDPVSGVANFAYVRLKNRGTQTAQNVRVRAFHRRPSGGTNWPADFQPLATAELSADTLASNSSQEKVVGPFSWTPTSDGDGTDRLLMIASADGDGSNADHFTDGESIPEWRLVPHDNNIGVRVVSLASSESDAPSNLATATMLPGVGALLDSIGKIDKVSNVKIKSLTVQLDIELA